MSEMEVRKARMEVERSTADFEQALDHLLNQVQQSADKLVQLTDKTRDITSKVREMVDVDHAMKQVEDTFGGLVDSSIERAKGSAEKFLDDLRGAAEDQIRRFDARPMAAWGGVLIGGFALGYILAKKTSDRFIST